MVMEIVADRYLEFLRNSTAREIAKSAYKQPPFTLVGKAYDAFFLLDDEEKALKILSIGKHIVGIAQTKGAIDDQLELMAHDPTGPKSLPKIKAFEKLCQKAMESQKK